MKPGQRLVQEEIATQLGISRIPIRGALKALTSCGLVVADPKGAYFVSRFDAADLREIYGLRVLLEPYAALAALPALGEADILRLRDLNDDMAAVAKSGESDRWTELNAEFHLTIYEASGQPRLMRIIRDLWFGRPTFSPLKRREQLHRSVRDHQAILAAIVARDGGTLEQLVRDHIAVAGERWSDLLTNRALTPG